MSKNVIFRLTPDFMNDVLQHLNQLRDEWIWKKDLKEINYNEEYKHLDDLIVHLECIVNDTPD